MLLVKESVLSLKEKTTQHWLFLIYNFLQVLKSFWDRVQLSIYSTRALFHKYFVGMKYR